MAQRAVVKTLKRIVGVGEVKTVCVAGEVNSGTAESRNGRSTIPVAMQRPSLIYLIGVLYVVDLQ